MDKRTKNGGSGWTPIPNDILTDRGLTHMQCRLYCILLSLDYNERGNGRKGYAFPSQDTLAEWLGCSRRAVQKALDALEARGYLWREWRAGGPKGGSSNRYYLLVRVDTETNYSSPRYPESERDELQFATEANYSSHTEANYSSHEEIKGKKENPEEEKLGDDSPKANHHAATAASQSVAPTFEGVSQTPVPASAESAESGPTPESVVSGLVAALGYDRVARMLGEAAVAYEGGGVVVHIPQALAEGWDNPTRTQVLTAIAGCGAVAIVGDGTGTVRPGTREADIPTPRAGWGGTEA
ncbi:MAG: hypothetical protein Kow00123_12050 [Anaerolineales bacterium]